MARRVNGVRFGDLHSYYDFGMWLSTRPVYGSPAPKTNTVEIPGMDGTLDMTEANSGEVKYTNRTLRFTFAKMVELDKQEDFKTLVRNALHGKYIQQIIPDEAPDWFYSGRVSVDFSNLTSWKLRCVITVDAAPYAMKVHESSLSLLTGDSKVQDFTIATQRAHSVAWCSDLRLGTKEFPAGLSQIGVNDSIIVKFPPNAVIIPGMPKSYTVEDAEGIVYTSNISDGVVEYGQFNISLSTLVSAGIELSSVFRVLIQGIGQCSLYANKLAIRTMVWNERKTVIPSIFWSTLNNPGGEERLVSADVIINGEARTITNKQTEYENILLREGWNDIVVPSEIATMDTNYLRMSFREGRL